MKWNLHLSAAGGKNEAAERIGKIGADETGVRVMAPKMVHRPLKLEGVPGPEALVIKRELIGLGGEAAISHEAYENQGGATAVIMTGSVDQLFQLAVRLADKGGGLSELARELPRFLDRIEQERFEVRTARGVLSISDRPVFMAVINCTPDSFYDRGRFFDYEKAVARGRELWAEGAWVLDVGGESTRPGSEPVSEDEELHRVIPVIERLAADTEALISIDTQKPEVARRAVKAGAAIINDISALGSPGMAEAAAETGAGLALMHMQGTPRTMQEAPRYDDLFGEIIAFLSERMDRAISAGVAEEAIIVDPGIGFGKTAAHNLELIRDLWRLKSLGRPIILGTSNKSFIGKVLKAEIDERAEGTAASLAAGVLAGAHLLRVHEVARHRPFVEMAAAIKLGERWVDDE